MPLPALLYWVPGIIALIEVPVPLCDFAGYYSVPIESGTNLDPILRATLCPALVQFLRHLESPLKHERGRPQGICPGVKADPSETPSASLPISP